MYINKLIFLTIVASATVAIIILINIALDLKQRNEILTNLNENAEALEDYYLAKCKKLIWHYSLKTSPAEAHDLEYSIDKELGVLNE